MKSPIVIIGAVLAVGALLFLGWRSQRTLEIGLPPREECASQAEAIAKALAHIVDHGGSLVPVLGTGSMQPHIPAASAGADPLQTIVAYVVVDTKALFSEIEPGNPCVYRPAWAKGGRVLHGAAQKDGLGWIMSGLANDRSESWERMTPENYEGRALRTFVWKQ